MKNQFDRSVSPDTINDTFLQSTPSALEESTTVSPMLRQRAAWTFDNASSSVEA